MHLAHMQKDLPMAARWLAQQLLAGESLPAALQHCSARTCGALAVPLAALSERCRAGMELAEALEVLRKPWAGTDLATLALALRAGQRHRAQLASALLQWSARLLQRRQMLARRRSSVTRRWLAAGAASLLIAVAWLIRSLMTRGALSQLLSQHGLVLAAAWSASLSAALWLARLSARRDR